MAALLDSLTAEQQKLVELVAEAFAADGEWPVFDYLEGSFDLEDKSAADTLASFPRFGTWNYAAVWWVGMGQMSQPTADTEVALTVLGMHQSKVLAPLVDVFFDVVEMMVARRRNSRLDRRKARELLIRDEDVNALLARQRRLDAERLPLLLYKLMEREPMLSAGGSLSPDGKWTRQVPREVFSYQGVRTIADYVERLERLTALPQSPILPAAASPLDLVASLDYLDAVWRVSHKAHLFVYRSAERTTKLAYPAHTAEELDSRLSSLGEILRSANASAKAVSGAKLVAATREHPLAPLEAHLIRSVDAVGAARIKLAVTDLEHALALRDAAQHAEAGDRAVRALNAFGIGHPIPDTAQAWAVVTTRVIAALAAIREELASAAS